MYTHTHALNNTTCYKNKKAGLVLPHGGHRLFCKEFLCFNTYALSLSCPSLCTSDCPGLVLPHRTNR